MQVLYQLSYVGANPNPSVVAADLDMIPARNDHKCPVGSGGVFVAVPGAFQGHNAPEASPAQSRRALRTQSGRDLTDTEAPMPIHGKEGVRGSNPRVGLLGAWCCGWGVHGGSLLPMLKVGVRGSNPRVGLVLMIS